jgi:putative endonuclease
VKHYYTYILASRPKGTLYIGVTSDLVKRIWEHKNKVIEGFTEKYNVARLVHYEVFDDPENAIKREKRLKHWDRQWKIDLIESTNPAWNDLYDHILSLDNGSSGQAGG